MTSCDCGVIGSPEEHEPYCRVYPGAALREEFDEARERIAKLEEALTALKAENEKLRAVAEAARRAHETNDSPKFTAQLEYEDAIFDLGAALAALKLKAP